MAGASARVAKRRSAPRAAAEQQVSVAVSSAVGRRRFILFVTGLLFLFGLVMVGSATSSTSLLNDGDPWGFLKRQVLWGALGTVAMMIAMRVPLSWLRSLAPMAIVVSGFTLLLVFIPGLGQTVNGATRWLSLGPVSVQPSEFAKFCVVLFLADFLARHGPPSDVRNLLKPAGYVVGGICLIIFLQRDLGTSLVTGGSILTLYVVCGTNWRLLAKTISPAMLLVVVGIISEPFRRQRFLAFIDPWNDPQGAGFQLVQGLIAIGSGGIFGVGLGHSVQKVHYVPEAHTDMIYSIVSEELGFVGTALILTGFIALGVVGMVVARRATDPFAALLAVGLTAMLCGQAVLNIGGVVGLLPLTGVPLPLVSYGGSSLLVVFTSLGLLANIAVSGSRHDVHDTAR